MKLSDWTLPILAVAVLGTAGISEVVARVAPKPGPVRITYWEKWTGFEGEALRAVVDDFNKSQDRIFVDLLIVSTVDQKTLMATAAGVPPDLAGLWQNNLAQFADGAALMDLTEMAREAGLRKEDYIPIYWDMCEYEGKTFAFPTTPATTALHLNTAMLREIGADPAKPPQTIEELTDLADKLVVRRPDGSISRSGFLPAEPGWWNFGWGSIFGGKLWNGTDTITSDSPENVRGFNWVQSFSKKYGPGELQTFRSGFGSFSSPQNAFMSRKVAMVLQGVWMYNFIDQYSPELEWSAVPFPHPADRPDLANHTFAGMDIITIPRGAKHPKEAFEFIQYLQRQDVMEKLCLGHRKNSPLRKVSEKFWREHKNPYIKLFQELAYSKNADQIPKTPLWLEYSAELNNAFDEIQLVRATPEDALRRVRERMQPKLDDFLKRKAMRQEAQK